MKILEMEDVLSPFDNIPVKFVPVCDSSKLWPWEASKGAEIQSIYEEAGDIKHTTQYRQLNELGRSQRAGDIVEESHVEGCPVSRRFKRWVRYSGKEIRKPGEAQ
jgi:hypothetical protein